MTLKSPVLMLLSVASLVMVSVVRSIAQEPVKDSSESCYMTTSSGSKIKLDQFCGASKSMDDENVTIKTLPNGNVETTVVGNKPYTTPDGQTIQLVDSKIQITWPNGVRSQLIPGAKGSGFQYYSTDGKKLSPGQTVVLPDGQKIKQERL